MTTTGSLVVRATDLDHELFEIEPSVVAGTPMLTVYNILSGRSPADRIAVMTLNVSVFRMIYRYLPVLFNHAERMSRSKKSTELRDRAKVPDAVVNNDDTNQGDEA